MKKSLLIILTFLMVAVIITSVPASDGTVQKSLLYDDIKITLDSREIKPCDVNGNYIEPFIIEGTTYLPVRGIASSLGLTVGWDGNTNTVSLTAPQNAEKTVLYNEGSIKAVYNGFEVTENGVVMSFFVNNASEDDIYFNVTVNSADRRSVENHKEYIVIRGRELNIKHLVPDVKKADKIKFSFSLQDAVTQLDICSNKEFTATSDSAESSDKKPDVSYSDPEGDITHENFAQFFKAYGKLKNDRYTEESDFTDRHGCHAGLISVGYSIPKKDMLLNAFILTDVYDPVLKSTSPMPVDFSVKLVQNEEKYVFNAVMLMNDALLNIYGDINASDLSVNLKSVLFDLNAPDVREKYARIDVQNEFDNSMKKACQQAFDAVVSEGENVFSEKGSRLNFEFFGLK